MPSNSKQCFETVCSVVFDLERLDGLLFATRSVLIITVSPLGSVRHSDGGGLSLEI